jgi:calcineurin-like phosphoesterase
VLPNGTAYCTDIGMTGPYDSVIGVDKDKIIQRFLTGMPVRFETAKGDPRFAAVVIDVDPETGRSRGIDRMLLTEADVKAL